MGNISRLFLLILANSIMISCNGSSSSRSKAKSASKKTSISITLPRNNAKIANNSKVEVEYSIPNIKYDSIVVLFNEKRMFSDKENTTSFIAEVDKFGVKKLMLKAYHEGIEVASGNRILQILPDFAPTQQNYQVVKNYPHDMYAYTQGLLYHNGYLYESTGQYGASDIRKVNLTDGKVLKSREIPKEYFGEGLCLFNNLLYQLTWRENKCFVYDVNTFELKNTLNIHGEGWGLTNDNKHLIMSNGSHIVSYLSPNDLSIVKQLEVCTNMGYVNHINELELINGELWANVYMTDNIVRIDTSSGAVIGVINLRDILPRSLQNQNTDVLNGIAYDEKSKRIFVTGKNWPRLYEIIVK